MKFPSGRPGSGLRQLIWWFRRLLGPSRIDHDVCYPVSLDEATISRSGDYARIEYKQDGIGATYLQIGQEIDGMSDAEIIKLHNECFSNEAKRVVEYKYIPFEAPLDSGQMEYFARCDQWVPKSQALCCLLQSDERGRFLVKIDDQELRSKQFLKLLTTYEGWGMRIEFVPREEVLRRPIPNARKPEAQP
jgi:hypothetical protein